jgi:acetyltransferase-like isoleucine patch superfamily enzyme
MVAPICIASRNHGVEVNEKSIIIQKCIIKGPIRIGDNGLSTFNSRLLHGINVGNCAIVSAGISITKDIDPIEIVVINSAKVICNHYNKFNLE